MMKKILLFMSLIASVSLPAQQNTTLILKDHSGSIQHSQKQLAKEQQLLKTILLKQVQSSGDQVVFSYLYRNTASVSNEKLMVLEIPEKFSDQSSRVQLFSFSFIAQVIEALESNQPRSDQTRILESIPRMLKWSQENLQVVILSDLLEYSPQRKLNSLKSREDAISKAKADVAFLIDRYAISSSDNSIQIDCYLPVCMMENEEKYQYLSFYWDIVFTAFFPNMNLNFHTL
jgi:hypothetical protein